MMQTSLSGRPLSVPYDGLIVRWATSGACTAPVRLWVLRPESGGAYRFVAGAEPQTTCTIKQYEVSVPVRQGDRIGLEGGTSYPGATTSKAAYQRFVGTPSVNASATPENQPHEVEYYFNATVEPDSDGDGYGDDSVDVCLGTADQTDTDKDRSGDSCDADDDNDGVPDEQEPAIGTDPKRPDTDGDHTVDGKDNCPTVSSPSQADLDHDGAGDVCDADDDGDGLSDEAEGSSYSRSADSDLDQRLDGADNCPREFNTSQSDVDRDGLGDACDDDDDADGVKDSSDLCESVPDPDQAISPIDGDLGDACDGDFDNDGASDAEEARAKTLVWDRDSDDDGLSDGFELEADLDALERDSDGDRLPDGLERGRSKPVSDPPGPVVGTDRKRFARDHDPRSTTNPRRRDSDRDGLSDGREDRDRDGIWDRKESDPATRDSDYDGQPDGRDRRPLRPASSSVGTSSIRCSGTEQLDYRCKVRVNPGIEVEAPGLSCSCRPYDVAAWAAVGAVDELRRRSSGGKLIFTGHERRVSITVGYRWLRASNTGRRPVDVYFSLPAEF
jgi:hypothetical protein